MLTIFLNGTTHTLSTSLSLIDLLKTFHLDTGPIAVAINQEIIPRSLFENKMIRDQDHIEIIKAVGGG